MAIVGEAYVVVRANTSSVERDIRKGFSGVSGAAASAGKSAGQKFNQGFKQSSSDNVFGKFSAGLRNAVQGADAARNTFHNLIRAGYGVGTALAGAVGGISAMVGGLGALVGAAGAASGALAAVGNVVASLGLGLGVAKLALGGVGKAVGAITKPATGGGSSGGGSSGKPGKAASVSEEAQLAFSRAMRSANEAVEDSEKSLAQVIENNRKNLIDANNDVRDAQVSLNDAIRQGQDEIKQLGFEAEDAALNEKSAALQLEKARAALAAVQDLPPNNSARLAAELAYQEADLNLRKAKDASTTLNAEQARLAKTGVAGTQVVRDATDALAEAQKAKGQAVVDSLRDQQEAETALAKAQRDRAETQTDGPSVTPATEGTGDFASGGGGGGGGVDPFAGLNEAQKNFAKFIASLKPKFDELKEIAANGFLPPLQEAIQNLVTRAFPTVATGVGIIAAAMGTAVNSIVNAITSAKDLENLSTIFESSGVVIENLGKVAGSLFSSLLTIMAAAAPLTERFTGFLVTAAEKFDAFLSQTQDDGSLGTFFTNAGDVAADFGEIFGNIFEGFGAIIMDTFGEGSGGQIMIQFLKDATAGFAELGSTAEGKADLRKFFQDVATNAVAVFDLLGDILGVFFEIGANPAIGEAAETLKGAIPGLQAIVDASTEAAPAFAELVVKIVDIIALLQDTGAIQVFFDTLSSIADVVISVFGNESAVAVLTFTGRLAAVALAFGSVFKIASFGAKALTGSIGLVSGSLGKVVTAGKGIGEVGSILRLAKKDGAGLSTAFSVLKDSTNPLSKAVGNVGGAFTTVGSKAATGLKTAGKAIADGVVATGTLAKQQAQAAAAYAKVGAAAIASKAKVVAQTTATIAAAGAQKAMAAAQKVAAAAQRVLNLAMKANPIGLIITAVGLLVAGFIYLYKNVKPFRDFINDLGKNIADGFSLAVAFVGTAFKVLSAPFSDFIDFIKDIFGIHSPSTFMADIGRFLIEGLVIGFQGLMEAVSGVWTAVVDFFIGLWDNIKGIVGGAIDFLITLFLNFTPLGLIISNWSGIVEFIVTLWQNVSATVAAGIQFVIDIIVAVGTAISDTWSAIWGGISTFFSAVWDGIVLVVTTYISMVSEIVTTVTTTIQTVWSTVWQGIKDFFGTIWDGIVFIVTTYINLVQTTIKNVVGFIVNVWTTTWNGIKSFFGAIWDGIVFIVTTYINMVRNTVNTVTSTIRNIWEKVWNGIKTFFSGIWDNIVRTVQGFGKVFSDAFSGIGGFIESAFSGALNSVKGSINAIIGLVNSAISSLNKLKVAIPDWVPGVGGQTFGLNIPKIPQLAKGGTVMPKRGGTLVNVAEAGRPERVEPLDENGLSKRDIALIERLAPGSGKTIEITINAAPGQSEAEIAQAVSRQIAFMMRKGSI